MTGTGGGKKGKSKQVRTAKASVPSIAMFSDLSERSMSVDEVARRIKRELKALGVYSSVHDALINSCAQQMIVRDMAFSAILTGGIVEREGDGAGVRTKLNPAFNAYRDITKELRGSLNDLQMNIRNSVAPEHDEMDKLVEVLNSFSGDDVI